VYKGEDMSADNYMCVKPDEDGDYHVWMVLGGYTPEEWEIGYRPSYFIGSKLEALEYAHEYCRKEWVEYGVVLLEYGEEYRI
jgi:hypothetical protein